MPASPVAGYYDRLTRWAAIVGPFRRRRWSRTVHRALADPSDGGRPTPTRVHDVVLEHLRSVDDPRVLDAGCGMGATMIDFARRLGGRYVGLTLSGAQASAARRAVVAAGLADRIDVLVHSYDDPPRGPFDVVLAIESLAHSPDPAITTAALIGTLAPGGCLVVVDDMPEHDAEGSSDLARFRAGWRCPVLWTADRYRRCFRAAGLAVVERDLTSEYRPRPLSRLALLDRLNRAAHHIVPVDAWRALMDSHHGGLALERLYRLGLMRYRLLAARRAP